MQDSPFVVHRVQQDRKAEPADKFQRIPRLFPNPQLADHQHAVRVDPLALKPLIFNNKGCRAGVDFRGNFINELFEIPACLLYTS